MHNTIDGFNSTPGSVKEARAKLKRHCPKENGAKRKEERKEERGEG